MNHRSTTLRFILAALAALTITSAGASQAHASFKRVCPRPPSDDCDIYLSTAPGSGMTVVNSEWPGPDKLTTMPLQWGLGSTGPDPAASWPGNYSWNLTQPEWVDDEINVRFYVAVKRNPFQGAGETTIVSVRAELYEGDNPYSDDLDGVTVLDPFPIGPNETVTKRFRVDNTDEGGDYANIKLVFRTTVDTDPRR